MLQGTTLRLLFETSLGSPNVDRELAAGFYPCAEHGQADPWAHIGFHSCAGLPHIEVVVVAACGVRHRDMPERCGAFPLRLVRSHQPLRRAEAENAALDSASGDWLNLLDDDDLFLPEHVSTLYKVLMENSDARLGYANSISIDRNGTQTEFGAKFKPWRQLDTGFFYSQAALFARALIANGARFDPNFEILEDLDFFVQCAQLTRFVYVPRATSKSYRGAGTSGTGSLRDPARINTAVHRLRTKWSALEFRLRGTPEFRVEQALWNVDYGQIEQAEVLLGDVLAERQDWPEALAVLAILEAKRGNRVSLHRALERLQSHEPDDADLCTRIAAIRARFTDASLNYL